MRVWLLIGLLSCARIGWGQPVQWASRVVSVSSEKRGEPFGEQFKASQALGRPSVGVRPAESPCAWAPSSYDGTIDEWIQVAFDKPVRARQILVVENINPGTVTKVIVLDGRGGERTVYENPVTQARPDPVLRIFPSDTSLTVSQIKVYINGSGLPGPNQIDAIGIAESKKPVAIGVNVSPGTPKEIVKENLGRAINSPGQEVAPVISPDGRTLYFTRNYVKGNIGSSDHQDVWYSTLESAAPGGPPVWSPAVNLGPPVNNAGDNAISSISANGKTIYLLNVYLPNGSAVFGLSKSVRTRTGWSFPTKLNIANNYNLPENEEDRTVLTEVSVSPEENVLVLAVRRKDTRGNRDLYVSFRRDSTWTEPLSLGPDVNTADAESSPFLAADGRTLYFTSKGHPGYGDGDIFVTRRLDDSWTRWSEPENLGPAINTAEWDGYFTIPASGDFAYLSSRANSLGEDDIFRLRLFPAIKPDPVAIISGQVLDAQTKKPVASDIVSTLVGERKDVAKARFDPEAGEYRLILPTQKTYNLTATRAGYYPATEVLDLSRDKRFRDIRRNLYLTPIEPGQKITLREVLFAQSQAQLLPGGDAELDRVVAMLNQYPQMEILIEGHTDNQGDWEPNMKLSEDRVRVVKTYLTGKGIAESRIQTKAWGPSKPIASNETDEKRRLNRRVEFTILKR